MQPLSDARGWASVIETLYEQSTDTVPDATRLSTPVLEDRKSHLSRKRSRIKKRDSSRRVHKVHQAQTVLSAAEAAASRFKPPGGNARKRTFWIQHRHLWCVYLPNLWSPVQSHSTRCRIT